MRKETILCEEFINDSNNEKLIDSTIPNPLPDDLFDVQIFSCDIPTPGENINEDIKLDDQYPIAATVQQISSSQELANWINYATANNLSNLLNNYLYPIARKMIEEFSQKQLPVREDIKEIMPLVTANHYDTVQLLLAVFANALRNHALLNATLLTNLARAIHWSKAEYLDPVDIVQILNIMCQRIIDMYKEEESDNLFTILKAFAALLDTLDTAKINNISRENLQIPLLEQFTDLQDKKTMSGQAARHCKQALLRVGTDEETWNRVVRLGANVAAIAGGVAATVLEGNPAAAISAFGNALQIKEEYFAKEKWYPVLRGCQILIRAGKLTEFEKYVKENNQYQRETPLKLGLLNELHELIINPYVCCDAKKQAITFIGFIFKWNDRSDTGNKLRHARNHAVKKGRKLESIRGIILARLNEYNAQQLDYGDHAAKIFLKITTQHHNTIQRSSKLTGTLTPQAEIRQSPASDLFVNAKRTIDDSAQVNLWRYNERRLAHIQYNCSDKHILNFKQRTLSSFMADANITTLLITGNPGLGKRQLAYYFERELINNETVCQPLYIDRLILRNQNDIVEQQLKKAGIKSEIIEELRANNNYIFCFIVYGYDTLDEKQLRDLYNSIQSWQHLSDFKQSKIIILCRNTVIKDSADAGFGNCRLIKRAISHLTKQQINTYLQQCIARQKKHTAFFNWLGDQNNAIFPLLHNPLMLSIATCRPLTDFQSINNFDLRESILQAWFNHYQQQRGIKASRAEECTALLATFSCLHNEDKIYFREVSNFSVKLNKNDQKGLKYFSLLGKDSQYSRESLLAVPIYRNGNTLAWLDVSVQHHFIIKGIIESLAREDELSITRSHAQTATDQQLATIRADCSHLFSNKKLDQSIIEGIAEALHSQTFSEIADTVLRKIKQLVNTNEDCSQENASAVLAAYNVSSVPQQQPSLNLECAQTSEKLAEQKALSENLAHNTNSLPAGSAYSRCDSDDDISDNTAWKNRIKIYLHAYIDTRTNQQEYRLCRFFKRKHFTKETKLEAARGLLEKLQNDETKAAGEILSRYEKTFNDGRLFYILQVIELFSYLKESEDDHYDPHFSCWAAFCGKPYERSDMEYAAHWLFGRLNSNQTIDNIKKDQLYTDYKAIMAGNNQLAKTFASAQKLESMFPSARDEISRLQASR